MKKISAGVIGCGNISFDHCSLLKQSDLYDLVALADISRDALERRAREFDVARRSLHYQDLLADPDVEAVWILTPPASHAEIAIAALRAGKHVFCEKPLARTSAECRAVAAAAQPGHTVFLLGYPLRHSRDALNLRAVIQSGKLGRPVFFRDVWALCKGSPSPAIHDAADGGGVLFEHTHWLDLVRFIFGPVRKVYGSTHRLKPGGTTAEDTFIAILDFVSGDQAVWSESWAAPGMGWDQYVGRLVRPTTDVIGTAGSLHFPGPRGEQRLTRYENRAGALEPVESWDWENDWGTSEDAFPTEHRHFYDCVRGGASPVCTISDGMAAIELSEAILESSRTGMPVFLETAEGKSAGV